jgi:malate dehydrogenase
MARKAKKIAVTGGAGNIAYSLLFRIARGDLLGPQVPIDIHILERPEFVGPLAGVRMELEDCVHRELGDIRIGSDPYEIFKDADFVFLVGAKPRSPGMERKDLLSANGAIFQEQGKALSEVASKEVKVLVIGNPCNTNCLIAIHNAPKLSPKNFFAMTRLDHNRAKALLASKAHVPISDVTRMTIWGNHSNTQVPDFYHARIKGKPAVEVISDIQWLETDFIKSVQQRGAEVIKIRGKSSAASAASSAIDAMRSILEPTDADDWFSMGIYAEENSYGIDKDLVFSFPCTSTGLLDCNKVENLDWNERLRTLILISEGELKEERDLVRHLL